MEPRVIHATHGWWFPEDDPEAPGLYGTWKANINKLLPGFKVGKLGYGAPYKNLLCKIYKVDGYDAGDSDPTQYVPREAPSPNSLAKDPIEYSYERQRERIEAGRAY